MSSNRFVYVLLFVWSFPLCAFSQDQASPGQLFSEAENSYVSGDYNHAIVCSQRVIIIIKDKHIQNGQLLHNAQLINGLSWIKKGYDLVGAKALEEALNSPDFKTGDSKYGMEAKETFQKVKGSLIDQKPPEGSVPPTEKKTTPEEKSEAVTKPQNSPDEPIQVRVIKKGAILRVAQDDQSEVIREIPLGAIMTVMELGDKWVKVKLNPNKDGIIIAGYILLSFLELSDRVEE